MGSYKNKILLLLTLFFLSECKSTSRRDEDMVKENISSKQEVKASFDVEIHTRGHLPPGHSPVNKNLDPISAKIDRLDYKTILKLDQQNDYAFYLRDRLTTPISHVVVTQIEGHHKRYFEDLGYSFLLNNPKFPSLTIMDDGTIVLTISAMDEKENTRVGYILTSKDGLKWTKPLRTSWYRGTPMNAGNQLFVLLPNSHFILSSWPWPHGIPDWHSETALPRWGSKTCNTDVAYSHLIEKDTIKLACWFLLDTPPSKFEEHLFTQGGILTFHRDTKKWEEPVLLNRAWGLNEGSIIRARNHNLVAAFRTQLVGTPIPSDHFMGLATTVSKDNGKTWSLPVQHFLYGRMHSSLLLLHNGDILMTYGVRVGQLDGQVFHGVEAVVSHDNGNTWDWNHRYIITRQNNTAMHSPHSVQLPNGKILTVYMHDTYFTYNPDGPDITPSSSRPYTGNVGAVLWDVQK